MKTLDDVIDAMERCSIPHITSIARDALTKMMLLKQDAGQKTGMPMYSIF